MPRRSRWSRPWRRSGRGTVVVNWVEERAEQVRRHLALGDLPGVVGLDTLCRWLEGRVHVERRPGALGICLHHDDGTASIWAPDDPEILTHEVGHALCTTGLGLCLRSHGHPIARRQVWKEEHIANRFARAFLLPPALFHRYRDDHELA